ncbi:hypothetical protein Tco_0968197 [Tanacetum coccineum]
MLDPEVRIAALPIVPFVTSSVSATPEHEGANVAEAEVDSVVTSSVPVIAIVTTVTKMVDVATIAKEAPIKPSLLGADSSSTSGTDPTLGSFSNVSGSEFMVGGIRTVVEPDFDLQKVYVLQWSINNESRVYDGRICRRITKVRMRAEYNIKGKRRPISIVDEQMELLKVMDGEIENFKAQLLLKEAEGSEAIRLRAEVSKFESIEKSLQDELIFAALVNVREQEAADMDAMVTSAKSWNGDLVDQVHWLEIPLSVLQVKVNALAIVKCLNSSEYLSILGAAISKARSFALPSTEMQDAARLASVALIHLLFVPHIPALSLSLDISYSRVQRIMENIVNNRLALHDVFVLFFEPLSIVALEGMKGNSGAAPDTTTALSTTYASASSIPPIFTDDYVVVHADNQESTGADVNPFPNVDDAELDISQ